MFLYLITVNETNYFLIQIHSHFTQQIQHDVSTDAVQVHPDI